MDKRAIFLCVLLISHPVLSEDLPQPGSSEDKEPDDLSYDFLKVDEGNFGNDDLNDPLEAKEAGNQLVSLQNPSELDEEFLGTIATVVGMLPGIDIAIKGIARAVSAVARRKKNRSRRRNLRRVKQRRCETKLRIAKRLLRRYRRSRRCRRG